MAQRRWETVLRALTRDVSELIRGAPSDEDAPDALGEIRRIERVLADYRRGLLAEVPAGTAGAHYVIAENRRNAFSYNTSAILRDVANATDASISETVQGLIAADAARLSFRYSGLTKYLQRIGVTYRVASGEQVETGDVDGAHIGIVEKLTPEVRPLDADTSAETS